MKSWVWAGISLVAGSSMNQEVVFAQSLVSNVDPVDVLKIQGLQKTLNIQNKDLQNQATRPTNTDFQTDYLIQLAKILEDMLVTYAGK